MREAPSQATDLDAIAPLRSWGGTTFQAPIQTDNPSEAASAEFTLDDLTLDDDVREELCSPYYKFRAFSLSPRPVIIVYEDGEEPLELARWVKTFKTNMRAIDEGWDENRRMGELPGNYVYYMVDEGAMFLRGTESVYAQEAMLEYRASRLIPKVWGIDSGRPKQRLMSMRTKNRDGSERVFFSFWRPWTQGGYLHGGNQHPDRPSTWGWEIQDPVNLYQQSCELERAQLGALVMEWTDSPEAKQYRKNRNRRPRKRTALARTKLEEAYKALYTLREDQVDEILEDWIPKLKKLSLIKAQGRQGD